MPTTLDTLTDDQIRALRDEADAAGDRHMSKLATYALDHWCHKAFPQEPATAAAKACLRAINDAEAQQ